MRAFAPAGVRRPLSSRRRNQCRTVEVFPDITTETIRVFRAHGLLRVDVRPSVAVDVLVDGLPRNQFGRYSFIAPGS